MVLFGCTELYLCPGSAATGKDQLAVLSRALTELTAPEWAAACSLALEGIAALCRAELLDVRTTWRILAPRLRQERRPAVLARYVAPPAAQARTCLSESDDDSNTYVILVRRVALEFAV